MSSILEYVTAADSTGAKYTNLVEAVTFANDVAITTALNATNNMLFAPEQLKFTSAPGRYRWSRALTGELLKNHVAVKTDLTDGGSITSVLGNNLAIDGPTVGGVTYKEEAGTDPEVVIYNIDGFLVPSEHTGPAFSTGSLLDEVQESLDVKSSPSVLVESVSDGFKTKLRDLVAVDRDPLFSEDLGYTAFLPSKNAFEDLVAEIVDTSDDGTVSWKTGVAEYLNDGGLDDVLKAHIVKSGKKVEPGTYTSMYDKSTTGNSITVTVGDKNEVSIDGVAAGLDVNAKYTTNGQAHVIDKVLKFPRETTVEIAEGLTTLYELLSANNLADAVGALTKSTVFAPTNDALNPVQCFQSWTDVGNTILTKENMETFLKHHVINGKRIYAKDLPDGGQLQDKPLAGGKINRKDIQVTTSDVLATNGNIHIVSKALRPSSITSLPAGTIVDIAASATTKLAEFVLLEGLEDIKKILSECGTTTESGQTTYTRYTVFAPSDTAFDALTEKDIDYLLDNEKQKLKELLKYHVVPLPAFSKDLNEDQKVKTLNNNEEVQIQKVNETISVGAGNAKVTSKDNTAYNGVVHVIDELLVPSTVKLPSQNGSAAMTSVSAISAAVMGVISYFIAAF